MTLKTIAAAILAASISAVAAVLILHALGMDQSAPIGGAIGGAMGALVGTRVALGAKPDRGASRPG